MTFMMNTLKVKVPEGHKYDAVDTWYLHSKKIILPVCKSRNLVKIHF